MLLTQNARREPVEGRLNLQRRSEVYLPAPWPSTSTSTNRSFSFRVRDASSSFLSSRFVFSFFYKHSQLSGSGLHQRRHVVSFHTPAFWLWRRLEGGALGHHLQDSAGVHKVADYAFSKFPQCSATDDVLLAAVKIRSQDGKFWTDNGAMSEALVQVKFILKTYPHSSAALEAKGYEERLAKIIR